MMNTPLPVEVPRICYERIVPDEFLTEAPAALSEGTVKESASGKVGDNFRLTVAAAKRWPPHYHLSCCFLNGTPRQRERVKDKAREWEKHCNIKFDFSDRRASEVRIAFDGGQGSWSAVGTNAQLSKAIFPSINPR